MIEPKCTVCHLTRQMHNYPYPERKHLFTTEAKQETKPMQQEEEDLTPTGRPRQPRRPCAVCGKKTHGGPHGIKFDHDYTPMNEKQLAARAATQGSGDGNGKPRRGRPRKAAGPPNADDLRRKRTKESLASKRTDRKDRVLSIATRVVQLQADLAEATAELEAMLE